MDISRHLAILESSCLNFTIMNESKLESVFRFDLGERVHFTMTHWNGVIAIGNSIGDIIILSGLNQNENRSHTWISRAHDQSVSVIQLIWLTSTQMLICSGSWDSFKIWDLSRSKDYPIFHFDTSKKWVYDCVFDPSILSIMINIEGWYFSHNIFSLSEDKIVEKKFNIFEENTTSTACHPNNPNIYVASINGIIYAV